MARRAVKDTYAFEQTGPDTEVRRLVKAGQQIPDHYYGFEDSKAVEGKKSVDVAAPGGDEDRQRPEDNEQEKATPGTPRSGSSRSSRR